MSLRALQIALSLLALLFIVFAGWVAFATAGSVHWSIPVAFVAIPVLTAVGVFLWTKLKARAGARKLEQALARDAAQHAEVAQGAGVAASGEVLRLQAEFSRAVGALKQTSLAGRRGNGQDALYRLPWYVMLGPPGVGKTTVLRNSGIQFPHVAGTGNRIKGVGGTRNCDWWLTNHGILLDTAGRWATEEEDHNEWLAFLDLLKRHRSQQPLNGVIAAVSLAGDPETSIAELDEAQVKQLAGRMRERLDELSGRLGVVLPVYVVFTKCDLLSGFVETFGDLTKGERKQIWGFTTPLTQVSKESYGEHFAERFDELCESLERHSLQRMEQEVRSDQIANILDFPAQVRSLQSKLGLFIRQLFEDHVFVETPIMRGVYLTSGTQEGSPADLLRNDLAGALQLSPVFEDENEEKKSYFLYDLLTKVVFADHHIATSSPTVIKQRQLQERLWTSGLLTASLLMGLLPFLAFRQSAIALTDTYVAVLGLERAGVPDPHRGQPEHLDEVKQFAQQSVTYAEGDGSLLPSFGMDQSRDIVPSLTALRGAAVREWVVRPLWNLNSAELIRLTHQFEGMGQGALGNLADDERLRLREALRTHLLLSTPRDSCEPALSAETEPLLQRLLALWQGQSPTTDPVITTERREQLQSYLQMSTTEQTPAPMLFERATDRVALAREALADNKGPGQLLVSLTERFSDEPITIPRMVGATTWLSGEHAVPAAFTSQAWRQVGRELTGGSLTVVATDWTLGCKRLAVQDEQTAERTEDLRHIYLEQYENHWRTFLTGLNVQGPRTLQEAETLLMAMSARPGVLGTLFEQVGSQTDLPAITSVKDAIAAKATAAIDSVKNMANLGQPQAAGNSGSTAPNAPATDGPPKPQDLRKLRRTFEGFASFGRATQQGVTPPLESYRQQLTNVQAALQAASMDRAQYGNLANSARSAANAVEVLVQGQGGEWSGVLRELLLPPLLAISSLAQGDAAQALQVAYCDQIYRPFQDELAGRYPLDVTSAQDVPLEALEAFFRPRSGTLWTFQREVLSGLVTGDGRRFRFGENSAMHGREVLREDLLSFLSTAAHLRDALFTRSGEQIRMGYRIRVRGGAGYRLTSVDLGGPDAITYVNGAERWVPLQWPAEDASKGAEVRVLPHEGPGPRPLHIPGVWALFKLLDPKYGHSTILERQGRRLTAGWKPKGSLSWVKVDFEAEDNDALLLQAPLGRHGRILPLKLPRRITHSGPDC